MLVAFCSVKNSHEPIMTRLSDTRDLNTKAFILAMRSAWLLVSTL